MIECRLAYSAVMEVLNRQAALLLNGPHQVGKMTLALDIADRTAALYLDLETRADRDMGFSIDFPPGSRLRKFRTTLVRNRVDKRIIPHGAVPLACRKLT